jgi:hypothetical protein
MAWSRERAPAGSPTIKIRRFSRMMAILVVVLGAAGTWAWVQSSAIVPLAPAAVLKLGTSRPGHEFALGAVGLSTEARELDTGYLSAAHYRLVRLMRLLGPSLLRIGGNSLDFSWWTSSGEPAPAWATSTVTPAYLAVLHQLLIVTGWRVLLGVDLGHFEPARAADETRYARDILGTSLAGIEIGNEPNSYPSVKVALRPSSYGVSSYLPQAETYRKALVAAAPGTAVYGPAFTVSPPWLDQIGAAGHMFTQLTQHYYPINTCPTTSPLSPQPTATGLLSPTVRAQEDEVLQTLALAGSVAGRPGRIGETNSVACGGNADASPGFAGALWSLDWALRAESSGVLGLNFHGRFGPCRSYRESPICVPGDGATNKLAEVIAQPEFYGLLAARQLEGGRFIPTRLIAPSPQPNITTWATVAPDGTVRIAIDNFATGGFPQPVVVPTSGYTDATEETLAGSSAEANSDITLGAVPVAGGGRWRPKPTIFPNVSHERSIRVIVQPASAVILSLKRQHSTNF